MPVPAPEPPVRAPPKVTEIYTKLTGAKAICFVPKSLFAPGTAGAAAVSESRPKFVPPPVDEYETESDEEEEDDDDDWVPTPLQPSSPFIAILDIFGFEVLKNNGCVTLIIAGSFGAALSFRQLFIIALVSF